MDTDASKSAFVVPTVHGFPFLATITRCFRRLAQSVQGFICKHLPVRGAAMYGMVVAVLFAATSNSASAAVSIIAEETVDGIVWNFSGSMTGIAGEATVSASFQGASDGYLLRYLTRGTGAPKSTVTVGYGGSVFAPYYTSVSSTSWSFLTKDSLINAPIGEPGQETIRPADNVAAMAFSSAGSDSVPQTMLTLYGNVQAMVLDRTMFSPGITFDDLNMTIELDTVYQLADGNTLQFVSVIPEAGSSLLFMIGGGAMIARHRRKTA